MLILYPVSVKHSKTNGIFSFQFGYCIVFAVPSVAASKYRSQGDTPSSATVDSSGRIRTRRLEELRWLTFGAFAAAVAFVESKLDISLPPVLLLFCLLIYFLSTQSSSPILLPLFTFILFLPLPLTADPSPSSGVGPN